LYFWGVFKGIVVFGVWLVVGRVSRRMVRRMVRRRVWVKGVYYGGGCGIKEGVIFGWIIYL
jgi:hypothetical protein